ncbi:MAG: hypothetical protein WCY19_08025 [Candidatus Gastranaerophilaceae bacterium]
MRVNPKSIEMNINKAYELLKIKDSKNEVRAAMHDFLIEGTGNPSVALMYEAVPLKKSVSEIFTKDNPEFQNNFSYNIYAAGIKKMKNLGSLIWRADRAKTCKRSNHLYTAFMEEFRRMYPKTKKLRNYLITEMGQNTDENVKILNKKRLEERLERIKELKATKDKHII